MQQRPQHLCIELAKLGYKVVFCDALYIENGRTVEYEAYPSGGSLNICYNIKNYARSTDLVKNRHICFFSSSKTAHTGNEIKSMINIWDYLDDFHINRLHDASALLAANAVVATAESLYQNAINTFQRGPVRLIENACPESLVEYFRKPTMPYPNLGKLKIYYIGAIAPWIMWDELFKFAKDNESILDLYLVGRRFLRGNEFKGVAFDFVLKDYPNIREIGHVSSDGLLTCFVDADAFILPFIPPHKADSQEMIDLMTGTNPIKFWEYLATGKPIITSKLPEVIRVTDNANGAKFPGVLFADTAEAMSSAVSLLNTSYLAREGMHIDIAAQNTWRHRAADLDKLIFELIEAGVDNQTGKKVTQIL